MSEKRNYREQLELEKQKIIQMQWEIMALREEIRAACKDERRKIARDLLEEKSE